MSNDNIFRTGEDLINYCRKHNIQYILLGTGYTYKLGILSSDWLGTGLLNNFSRDNFKPFSLVKRFKHGINSLLLLKIPNN